MINVKFFLMLRFSMNYDTLHEHDLLECAEKDQKQIAYNFPFLHLIPHN